MNLSGDQLVVDQPDIDDAAAPAASVESVGLLRRWQHSEPIRLYVYGIVGAALPLLLQYGLMTGETAALWSALAAAVLGVAAAEGLRSQVVSPRTAQREQLLAARAAVTGERQRALSITMRAARLVRTLPPVERNAS